MALSDVTLKAKTHKDENGNIRKAPYKLCDEMGLYVQVTSSGGKCWRFKYRYAGKEKLLTLGTYPDVGLAKAREARDNARKLLAQDPPVDPSEVKKAKKIALYGKQENTFEVVARERAESYFTNKSDSHKERTIRRLEIYIFPWLGSKPINEITAPEVLQVIKRPQNQTKLETAHSAPLAVSQVIRYAVQNGKALRDVTPDLRGAFPSATLKRMASFIKPQQVVELLSAIEVFQGTFTVECALRLPLWCFRALASYAGQNGRILI